MLRSFNDPKWVWRTLATIFFITAFRIVSLTANQTDLYIDEAQYWFWGQNLDFGYFSKPPMIGWLLRLVTDAAGSSEAFWIRLPAPILHGITAALIFVWGRQLYGPSAGFWAAITYLTLPIVVVGSLLMSTDTVMAPFLAIGLIAHSRLAREGGLGMAGLAGLAVGLAFMAKYAAVYFFLGITLSSLFVPEARFRFSMVIVLLLAFALAISPNVIWNFANDLTTVSHTMENVEWVTEDGASSALKWQGALIFLGSQAAVFGPLIFLYFILATAQAHDGRTWTLILFSWPVILLVTVQALLAKAFANWAFAACLPAVVLTAGYMAETGRERLLALGVAVNIVIAVALPLATQFPSRLQFGEDPPVLSRYLGRTDLSREIFSLAEARDADLIVSANRGILADLFHVGRDRAIPIFSAVSGGPPRHYYEQTRPFDPMPDARALYVGLQETLACGAGPAVTLDVKDGAYHASPVYAHLVTEECFDAVGRAN